MSYQALLFCPDEKTARVVTQVLSELDFAVEPCNEPFAAVKKLMAQHFDAVVVDCENQQNAMLLFKSARNSGSNQSSLAVAVVEGQAGVAQAFRIGANLVLTKPINVEQSKGTLRVARGLLRKADANKAAAPPVEQSAPPPVTAPRKSVAPPAPKPPEPPKPAAPPAQPVLSGSPFEVEEDTAPKPEPAEAALLETMSDSLPAAPSPSATRPMKDYPWQPASKLAEPMASALRRAAEAAAKSAEPVEPVVEEADILDIGSEPQASKFPPVPFASEAGSHGAASAPAPARQAPAAVKSPQPSTASISASGIFSEPELNLSGEAAVKSAPQVEPPDFAFGQDESEGSEGKKSKLPYIIVAAALLLIGTAYMSYTRHASSSQTVAPPVTQTQAPGPQTVTDPKPSALVPTATVTPSNPPSSKINEMIQSAATPSKSESSKPAPQTTSPKAAAPEADEEQQPPLMVKSSSKPSAPKPAETEVAQAPDLSMNSGSSNQTISGLVSSVPVSVPKASPHTVKISQGVSQGLITKKVTPVYPSQAQQMRLQGVVELMANISKEGNISDVKVLSGPPVLARAAVDAVKQWKYKPYFLNGEPVEVQTQVTINFQLP